MIIEDLIEFDKTSLTNYRLVWARMGKVFYAFYISGIFLSVFAYLIPVLFISHKNPKFEWLLLCVPSMLSLFYLGRLGRKKMSYILNQHNKEFGMELKLKDKFFNSEKIMAKIRYLTLKKYLQENGFKPKKEEINKIIEALKYESSNSRYNYRSIAIIIGLISVMLGSFLGSFLKFTASATDLRKIAINILIVFFAISIMAFIIEELVIKDLIHDKKRNKYQRLIRALENYSINDIV
jgi:hypothetical protein